MFNLNDYEDVDSRIHKFYETYPDGAILTEQVLHDEEKGIVLFKAIAYRTHVDTQPSAIGYARGSRKDRGVDRDFWYENCETSSIGRCLATWDCLLEESELHLWKWLRLTTLSRILRQYAYEQKNIKNSYRQQILELK